ncbi:MAG: 16S rRNA (adenine(1518)-N(6)/adenine(1519)-N(6))-dimethyltransferase [Candidatus Nomurabacteria bacterium]|jgi:16S rRNA (adenine1518-N6/adenine1519-N6)-dimethyltransferase|nr:16S rRNA (adenine(1518)-N(6)/adenine(1519)-N(6))-dimethyltransferase [Candidatus Nomurabacteria bacterium]
MNRLDPESRPKKSLGQHWLRDTASLESIADAAEISPEDVVVEIGPGLGTLTEVLAQRARKIIAIEFDGELTEKLESRVRALRFGSPFLPSRPSVSAFGGSRLPKNRLAETGSAANGGGCSGSQELVDGKLVADIEVINADFLNFNLETLPEGYKIVGNIPYYITGKIVRKCLETPNKPISAVFLVQKEVAQRIAAKPGEMSVLGVMSQFYAETKLGPIIKADKFDPPPKVDSQVVILHPRNKLDVAPIERVVKAGFSARRKKLRTALAGGLNISVAEAEKILKTAKIDPNQRAQNLSLDDWRRLTKSATM